MARFFTIAGISFLVILPILLGLTVYGVHLLALEVDTKFYEASDAVPTKVYSRLFWLRPGDLLSEAELRIRLQKRKYEEVAPRADLKSGTFSWEEVEPDDPVEETDIDEEEPKEKPKKVVRLAIRLRPFDYPPSVATLFFDPDNVGTDYDHEYIMRWEGGEINSVVRIVRDEEEEVSGLALEPVLVAQLNSNDKQTREHLPLTKIPYTLLQAIVSVEDQRFLEHSGIDPRGILRSIWVNLRAGKYRQGASTITQQMVRNIYLSRAKTLKRKIKEMIMAILIEFRFSKDEILEKYLNEVYFGQLGNLEIHGVSQAAKHYFGKTVQTLSIAEQALLAALVRGPFYYSPTRHFDRAKKRQEFVLKKMVNAGVITKRDFSEAMREELIFVEDQNVMDRSPYFTDFIKAQLLKEIPDEELMGVGYQIFSTLDTYYQNIIEEKVEQGVIRLEKKLQTRLKLKRFRKIKLKSDTFAPLQAVFILLDPKTNQLLAIVGGKSYRDSNFNRALYMRRQIGSVMKPFVYLTGLIHGANEDGSPLNAVSKLEDAPFVYKYDNQTWKPRNYDPEYRGFVTLRYSLAHSINIPTARLAVRVGIDKVIDVAEAAGIETEMKPLPSLSLGAVEIPPIEIAAAYTTLANLGYRRELTSVLAITDNDGEPVAQFIPNESQLLPAPEVANLLEMMRSVFEYGTAKSAKNMGFDYPAIGKTGTTNDYRDSWFVGFTPRLLGLAWVGYDKDDEDTHQN